MTVSALEPVPSIEDDNQSLVAEDFALQPQEVPTGTPDLPALDPYSVPPATDNAAGDSAVALAESWLGVKYVYGGNNRSGIDCSGLVQQVYKDAYGIALPRISYQQANGGQRIQYGDLQPGDLVAWDNSDRNPGADHIAIYVGNGQIIEAPHPGALVRMRKLDLNGYDRSAFYVTYRGQR